MKPLYVNIKNIRSLFYQTHLQDIDQNIKTPFEILIKFYCSAIDDYGQTNKVIVDKFDSTIVIPELHPLKFPINDLRFIKFQKLIAVVYQVKAEALSGCVGQAVILLNEGKVGESRSINGRLQLNSRIVGEISLEYSLAS